jgi:hypothetical protein
MDGLFSLEGLKVVAIDIINTYIIHAQKDWPLVGVHHCYRGIWP